MFGYLKMAMVVVMITGLAGAGMYVMKLRSDNAILKANQIKLEEAVSSQKELIAKQQEDFKEILKANNKMNELVSALKKDLDDLDKRFNKKGRDFGKLAIEKTETIQRIINGASDKAIRCVEIAGGSPLTEQEKTATKKSEINRECPSIANPNYHAYGNQMKIILILISIILLTGCSIGEKQLKIFKLEEPRQKLELQKPTMPELEKLRWIIITSDNAEEVFQKMEEQGLDPVLFGLSDKDFQLIAKNFAQIRAHLKHTNDLLDQYKEYYEPNDKEKK